MKKTVLLLGAVALSISVRAQQRVPLFEVFTSSTCGPCNNGNAVYEGILSGKDPDEYVSVKYQQNFPGTGDPYCTNETVNRRSNYYAIGSIPRMEIDGGWDDLASHFTQSLYDQYRATPATAMLSGTYSVSQNKAVTASVTYVAMAAMTSARLHVVVVESRTTKNKKSNGETQFFNVVKKMLPDQNGTWLGNLAVGATASLTLTYTFPGDYRLPADGQQVNRVNLSTENTVEDSSGLRVVCWLQDGSKGVAQAANLSKTWATGVQQLEKGPLADCKVFPNPASTAITIQLNAATTGTVSALLVNMAGAVVARRNELMTAGHTSLRVDTGSLPAGSYSLIVLDDHDNSYGQMVTVSH